MIEGRNRAGRRRCGQQEQQSGEHQRGFLWESRLLGEFLAPSADERRFFLAEPVFLSSACAARDLDARFRFGCAPVASAGRSFSARLPVEPARFRPVLAGEAGASAGVVFVERFGQRSLASGEISNRTDRTLLPNGDAKKSAPS